MTWQQWHGHKDTATSIYGHKQRTQEHGHKQMRQQGHGNKKMDTMTWQQTYTATSKRQKMVWMGFFLPFCVMYHALWSTSAPQITRFRCYMLLPSHPKNPINAFEAENDFPRQEYMNYHWNNITSLGISLYDHSVALRSQVEISKADTSSCNPLLTTRDPTAYPFSFPLFLHNFPWCLKYTLHDSLYTKRKKEQKKTLTLIQRQ